MGSQRVNMTERLDNKGNILAKIGTIKDRKGMDLTEAEEMERIHRRTIQKRSS